MSTHHSHQTWRIDRISDNQIRIEYHDPQEQVSIACFRVKEYGTENEIPVRSLKILENQKTVILETDPLRIDTNYEVGFISKHGGAVYLEAFISDELFNRFYSQKEMGLTIHKGFMGLSKNRYTFRLFSPRAKKVILSLFDEPYDENEDKETYVGEMKYEMKRDQDGVWETELKGGLNGKFYGYRILGPEGSKEIFNPSIIVADPYSPALATYEDSPQKHLSVIIDPSGYRWKSKRKNIRHRELVIYESHIRDLTMLSPDIRRKGTYLGLTEDRKTGGLSHIKQLGVNAVEFLPVHEFNEIEAPYMEESDRYIFNTWNPYGRSHTGYMSASYFAPESLYDEGTFEDRTWIGKSGKQTVHLKQMIDCFHQNHIAVILDVVYNHVSQYDRNPLKYIDYHYYFFKDYDGNDESRSGCGNDFRSDRPMARKLIIDSLCYWAEEYQIDGFRFDLGTIIDWETYQAASEKLRQIHPGIFLTVEPWMGGRGNGRDGGDYALIEGENRFSEFGISAWNDKLRNLIRGMGEPEYGSEHGLAFGQIAAFALEDALHSYPGIFRKPEHSLNYIESHDNHTFTDYLRIGNEDIDPSQEIDPHDYLEKNRLTDKQLRQHQISMLFLISIQGPMMIHEGQELGRMKLVFPPSGRSVFPKDSCHWSKDENGEWKDGSKSWHRTLPYHIDGDSYEKDNETNWINWNLKDINSDLFQFYRQIIDIRKKHPGITSIDTQRIRFIHAKNSQDEHSDSALAYIFPKEAHQGNRDYLFIINTLHDSPVWFDIKTKDWKLLFSTESEPIDSVPFQAPPLSGFLFMK